MNTDKIGFAYSAALRSSATFFIGVHLRPTEEKNILALNPYRLVAGYSKGQMLPGNNPAFSQLPLDSDTSVMELLEP